MARLYTQKIIILYFDKNFNVREYLSPNMEKIGRRRLEYIFYTWINGFDFSKILNWSVNVLNIRRGDIFFADLRPVVGSEQGGIRPVLIIQNDMGNRHSPTVICAAITSKMNKAKLPTHVALEVKKYDIIKDSVILLEQIRTIDKSRLREKVCHLDDEILCKIDKALCVSLALESGAAELRHTRIVERAAEKEMV